MTQFRKDTYQYLNDGKTIFEANMLGSRVAASGTSNGNDALGAMTWEEVT